MKARVLIVATITVATTMAATSIVNAQAPPAFAIPTYENELTADVLRTWCDAPHGSPGYDACALYMLGFVRGMQVANDRRICLPLDYQPNQLMTLLSRFLSDYGDLVHLPANRVLEEAVSQAFGCP
jgi:hypothetical protein